MDYTFSVPCLMGVESLLADELRYGGFAGVEAENGRVLFSGGLEDAARANLWLRCGERVLWRLARFPAPDFEALFQGVKQIGWEELIGKTGAFPVKGYSLKSKLHSVPACQSIVKKAVATRLSEAYGLRALPETGSLYQIQFSLQNDQAEIYLDTSGDPLYKRGYKREQTEASLRETLAASLVKLARYRGRETFYDPMCGSGTIAIEAAQAALNLAPGLNRRFSLENWTQLDRGVFPRLREEARDLARREALPIRASDIDPKAVELARENARLAGVGELIGIEQADMRKLDYADRGVLITNPPYGIRLSDQESARRLYGEMGRAIPRAGGLKLYLLSADEEFERHFGRPADKKRKLYNGMIKCNLHMYYK